MPFVQQNTYNSYEMDNIDAYVHKLQNAVISWQNESIEPQNLFCSQNKDFVELGNPFCGRKLCPDSENEFQRWYVALVDYKIHLVDEQKGCVCAIHPRKSVEKLAKQVHQNEKKKKIFIFWEPQS